MNLESKFIPSAGVRKNCVITIVRVPDPQSPGRTRRTSVSMHVAHFSPLAEQFGGATMLLKIIRYTASLLPKNPGDSFSQMVWASIDKNRAEWLQAIESGAF